jgi:hypothetical protein
MYVHYAFLFNFFLHAYKITHDQKLFCIEDFALQTTDIFMNTTICTLTWLKYSIKRTATSVLMLISWLQLVSWCSYPDCK